MSECSADEKTRGNAGGGPAAKACTTQDDARKCPLAHLTRREFVVAGCSTAAPAKTNDRNTFAAFDSRSSSGNICQHTVWIKLLHHALRTFHIIK